MLKESKTPATALVKDVVASADQRTERNDKGLQERKTPRDSSRKNQRCSKHRAENTEN
jgi:hypothetical protein